MQIINITKTRNKRLCIYQNSGKSYYIKGSATLRHHQSGISICCCTAPSIYHLNNAGKYSDIKLQNVYVGRREAASAPYINKHIHCSRTCKNQLVLHFFDVILDILVVLEQDKSCRIDAQKPRTHIFPVHPRRITVWYGFQSRGIIG